MLPHICALPAKLGPLTVLVAGSFVGTDAWEQGEEATTIMIVVHTAYSQQRLPGRASICKAAENVASLSARTPLANHSWHVHVVNGTVVIMRKRSFWLQTAMTSEVSKGSILIASTVNSRDLGETV